MTDRRTFLRLAATAGGAAAVSGFTGWRGAGRSSIGDVVASAAGYGATPRYQGLPDVPAAQRALRILILGGTGLTGPFQVRYAQARGHNVTVFNRGRHNDRLPKGVTELIGDRNLHQVDPLKGKEWDVVIDNPTTLPFWVKDAAQVLKGHVGQYVFISTISVYDPKGQQTISEGSPLVEYKDGDPLTVTAQQASQNFEVMYGRMKTASEREAQKWFGDMTTIIRPGLIVGPGDTSFRFTYWPWRIARGGEVLAPGDGTDAIQIIDARDLAEWTIRMVESKTPGTFNAVGPRARMSMAEQLYGIRGAQSGDVDVRFTWVPAEFLASQQVSPWANMPTWLPRTDPEYAISQTDSSRAISTGLTFRSLATTSVDTLTWYIGQPEAARTQMVKAAGLTDEKEKAVLAAWHAQRGK